MVVRGNARFRNEQTAPPHKVLVAHIPERKLSLLLAMMHAQEKALRNTATLAGTEEQRPQKNLRLRNRLAREVISNGDKYRMRAPDRSPAQNRETIG